MKRTTLALVTAVVVLGGLWVLHNLATAQTTPPAQPAERSVTITESQLEKLVQQRLAKEKAKPISDQEVLAAENWHRAIFNGVEYTVYTGPGQAMSTRWAPVPGKQPAAGTGGAAPGAIGGTGAKAGTTPAKSAPAALPK